MSNPFDSRRGQPSALDAVGVEGLQNYCNEMNQAHSDNHGLHWFLVADRMPDGRKQMRIERKTRRELSRNVWRPTQEELRQMAKVSVLSDHRPDVR